MSKPCVTGVKGGLLYLYLLKILDEYLLLLDLTGDVRQVEIVTTYYRGYV